MSSVDDDDDAEMNSSCAAVSQILLSLDDALLSVPQHAAAVHRAYIDDDSQSTVDGAAVTLRDSRLMSGDRDREVADETQVHEVDCDETQYVEHCCVPGRPAPLAHCHSRASENSVVTRSTDNSPSLLDGTRLLSFIRVQPGTGTSAAPPPADVATDMQLNDADTERGAQVTQGACDDRVPVRAVCRLNDSRLPPLSSPSTDDDQLSGGAVGSHVTVLSACLSSHPASHSDCVEISDDDCPSPSASSAHTACTSLPASAGRQVDSFVENFPQIVTVVKYVIVVSLSRSVIRSYSKSCGWIFTKFREQKGSDKKYCAWLTSTL